jgi:hypothetical protein
VQNKIRIAQTRDIAQSAVKYMGTPKIIAISNRDAWNVQETIWQTSATEKKDRVMSGVSSVVEIILRITRDVRSTRTYERKQTHLSVWNNIFLLHKSNKHYTLNAQITKQNSYAATSIEQDQHINRPVQQTSDIQDLKNMIKSLFE